MGACSCLIRGADLHLFEHVIRDEEQLGDVVSGIVVLDFEHCSPRNEIKNRDQVVTEEEGCRGVLSASARLHHSEVQDLTIFELRRNLQFCLQGVFHHVHVGRVGPRELQTEHPVRLLAKDQHASRFRAKSPAAILQPLSAIAISIAIPTALPFEDAGYLHALNAREDLLRLR